MADILHEVPIKVPPACVFQAVTRPEGLDRWWTKESSGRPELRRYLEQGETVDYERRLDV